MSDRLRILFLAPYEPSELAARSRLLLAGLAARHHVDVLALHRSGRAVVASLPVDRLELFASAGVDRALALRHVFDRAFPLQSIAGASRGLSRAVRAAVAEREYDLVHVEHIRALPHLPPRPRPPVLFDAVDCVSQLFALAALEHHRPRRWLFEVESRRVARFERSALVTVDHVIVAAERDAASLRALNPFARVAVVSNPVDPSRLPQTWQQRARTVVMTGKMSFHANAAAGRWLCDEIWPLVRSRHPSATLIVAGANPSHRLRRSAGQGVVVTGWVGDLTGVVASASVAVAPLRYAVGVQNKVLDALACATPVVATPQAVGDLRLRDGRDVLVACNAAEFATQISRLLDDSQLAQDIGEAGRIYVERHHSPSRIISLLEREYEAMLRRVRGDAVRASTLGVAR